MGNVPIIQKISLTRYQFPVNDVGKDLSFAMGAFYQPGGKGSRVVLGIQGLHRHRGHGGVHEHRAGDGGADSGVRSLPYR